MTIRVIRQPPQEMTILINAVAYDGVIDELIEGDTQEQIDAFIADSTVLHVGKFVQQTDNEGNSRRDYVALKTAPPGFIRRHTFAGWPPVGLPEVATP